MKLVKSALLLATVSSIAACGGGGSSVEEASNTLNLDASVYDTNNDGWLDISEAKAAWTQMSAAEKEYVAKELGMTVEAIDAYAESIGEGIGNGAVVTEAALGFDMNGDGDLLDKVGLYKDDYTFANGTTKAKVTVTQGAWSAWSKTSTANAASNQQYTTCTFTKSRTITTTTTPGTEFTDNDGNVIGWAETGDATTSTKQENETKTEQCANPNYLVGTWLQGFDLTLGTESEESGREELEAYYESILPAGSNVEGTVDAIYTKLDVKGLKWVHENTNWTGEGTTISIYDDHSVVNGHGDQVLEVSWSVAPGASFTANDATSGNVIEYYTHNGKTYTRFKHAGNLKNLSADIVNVSYGLNADSANIGQNSVYAHNGFASINADTDKVIVKAAGNDGKTNKGIDTLLAKSTWSNADVANIDIEVFAPEINSTYDGVFVVVGALNASNTIASYSNRAGDAKDWFIVADGYDLAGNQGTSYAAPKVSGALALVQHKFANITASQSVDIIFNTADDLGAEGVDEIYGHGELNVKAALSPVGTLD